MARIVIKCFPAPGFDGVFRAGRKWPASGIEVETVSGADDFANEGVPKVGTATLELLEADGRFSVSLAGKVGDLEAIEDHNLALTEENASLRTRVAEMEKGILSLKDQASALADENAALKAKLAAVSNVPATPLLTPPVMDATVVDAQGDAKGSKKK